jgi:hypothetical protein
VTAELWRKLNIMNALQLFCGKKFSITFSMLMITSIVIAQNYSELKETTKKPDETSIMKVVRINFLGLAGLNYEEGLGGPFSINLEAGLGFPLIRDASHSKDGSIDLTLESIFNPYLNIEGRYYYNIDERKNAGKRTEKFSANYVAAFYHYNVYGNVKATDETQQQLLYNMSYIGMWWGMQRNLGCNQRLYFNFSIGPCLRTDWNSHADVNVASHLGLGIQW